MSITHWPSDNDVLDPEVQASVDFAAQEKRATPPEGQLITFFVLFFALTTFLNEKIESRKFQIVLQPKLVISIFY